MYTESDNNKQQDLNRSMESAESKTEHRKSMIKSLKGKNYINLTLKILFFLWNVQNIGKITIPKYSLDSLEKDLYDLEYEELEKIGEVILDS